MNIVWAILLLAGGFIILARCADLLVEGAVGLAKLFGVSQLVIGLTVVAMGTSAPEVAASITAAIQGMGDVAIGNVYGSNIANLALVGGLAALIRPLQVQKKTLCREIPVMILVALLLWPILHNLSLSRPEGIILLAVFAVLIVVTVFLARKEAEIVNRKLVLSDTEGSPIANRQTPYDRRYMGKNILFVLIGLAGLALGAGMAVRGAVVIGELIGLSKAVIGLTIVAVGTSLPELATCVAAAIRGHHDISIGNLVGSNIFNTLLVVGTAGTVRPFIIGPRLVGVDYWIMIVVSVGFAAVAVIGRRKINRPFGAMLICAYIAYMIYLFGYTRAI